MTVLFPHPELASTLSKGDVAELRELSDASQVQAWTRRKVAGYMKYIQALLAIHNSIAPINKLPTELLQRVFAYIPFKEEWCDASWMLSLQSVCRRWRSVLLATPEYWLHGLYTALHPWNQIVYRDIDDEDENSSDKDENKRQIRRRYLVELFLDRSTLFPLKLKVWRTSYAHYTGWETFEDRFDRVTTFEVGVNDADDFCDAFRVVATRMKRLESLELCIKYESDIYGGEFALVPWKAENLPCLGQLQTNAPLFCRAMTVPSLHTITLYGSRDIETLSGLLDALEGCPALTVIHQLYFKTDPARGPEHLTLDRIVSLPKLRSLELLGFIPTIYSFLSCLSFPWTTKLGVAIDGGTDPDEFALPSILPRRISGLHTYPTVDRLYIHSQHECYITDPPQPYVSMTGFVQGVQRLQVRPVFQLCRASHFLQFLEAFAACTVTELALDLGPLPHDLDGGFWRQFFAALPDVRRLELLSRTQQSRATKRVVAEHFLTSVRTSQEVGHGSSLAWVLHAEGSSTLHLEDELSDIERVLLGHAYQGGHLSELELYVTISGPDDIGWSKVSDVARIITDREASRVVTRDYVSRLAGVSDAVIVGGGWGFAEDDGSTDNDELCGRKDKGDEESEAGSGSDDMQVM